MKNCSCFKKHDDIPIGEGLGDVESLDSTFDEAWFICCKSCKSIWLRILYEATHYSKSNHWYDALLSPETNHKDFLGTKENIEMIFLNSEISFCGGSFFDGKVKVHYGPPKRLV